MEKYTIDALRAMLCKELDETVTRGIKTHEDLDIVKDSTEALKNLDKIEKNLMERNEDVRGYSQRRPMMYNYYDGNSYMNENMNMEMKKMPEPMMNGYSRTDSKEEVVKELHQIANQTNNEKIRGTIMECISKMENMF